MSLKLTMKNRLYDVFSYISELLTRKLGMEPRRKQRWLLTSIRVRFSY